MKIQRSNSGEFRSRSARVIVLAKQHAYNYKAKIYCCNDKTAKRNFTPQPGIEPGSPA